MHTCTCIPPQKHEPTHVATMEEAQISLQSCQGQSTLDTPPHQGAVKPFVPGCFFVLYLFTGAQTAGQAVDRVNPSFTRMGTKPSKPLLC